jgi:hypothetical protein
MLWGQLPSYQSVRGVSCPPYKILQSRDIPLTRGPRMRPNIVLAG